MTELNATTLERWRRQPEFINSMEPVICVGIPLACDDLYAGL